MPELPEVESVRRVLAPELEGRRLTGIVFKRPDLRWTMPRAELRSCVGARLTQLSRRGKYLVFDFEDAAPHSWIGHLGMSGKMLLDEAGSPRWRLHEHYRLRFEDRLVRYVDPRRFGALLSAPQGRAEEHPLLAKLGPDPFESAANAREMLRRARGSKVKVKSFLLDARKIAGVGNIYANEALFVARISPMREAGKLGEADWGRLLSALREVMSKALDAGGTTLRDHVDAHGEPGWFQLQLTVYGRRGEPCVSCGMELHETREGGRSTFFCPRCQDESS
jgi:formamidopyrimidine-DNA glycosylase